MKVFKEEEVKTEIKEMHLPRTEDLHTRKKGTGPPSTQYVKHDIKRLHQSICPFGGRLKQCMIALTPISASMTRFSEERMIAMANRLETCVRGPSLAWGPEPFELHINESALSLLFTLSLPSLTLLILRPRVCVSVSKKAPRQAANPMFRQQFQVSRDPRRWTSPCLVGDLQVPLLQTPSSL